LPVVDGGQLLELFGELVLRVPAEDLNGWGFAHVWVSSFLICAR